MRLIDADDVKRRGDCYLPEIRNVISNILSHTKTVKDAVVVVRCKDCRYFHKNVWGSDVGIGRPYDCLIVGHCGCEFWGRKEDGSMTQTSEEAFCSFGERRSE